jgi:hypothetical protein
MNSASEVLPCEEYLCSLSRQAPESRDTTSGGIRHDIRVGGMSRDLPTQEAVVRTSYIEHSASGEQGARRNNFQIQFFLASF